MHSWNIRLRNDAPHIEPVPGVASLSFNMGFREETVYVIRSTVPPPASQRTNVSPTLRSWGSMASSAYNAAASGSETMCRAVPLPIPAASAQALVLLCAISDHTAGTVTCFQSIQRNLRFSSILMATNNILNRNRRQSTFQMAI